MSKRSLASFFAAIFCVAGVIAQDSPTGPPPPEPRPFPRQISGGVLNGKAISLPQPVYPPAAKAVRAAGAVTVQVLIDEGGTVISAAAVSGHPLLRDASVEAARGAQFSPTTLAGQPVKVTGVITYNFIPPPEQEGILAEIPHEDRNKIWALGLMFGFVQSADPETIKRVGNEDRFYEIMKDVSTDLSSNMTQYKPVLERLNSRDLTIRSQAARDFVGMIRKEFSSDQNWQIDIGEQVGFLLAELLRQKTRNTATGAAFDENPIRTYLRRISELVAGAPTDFTPVLKEKFHRVAAFSEVADLATDRRLGELVAAIMPLFEEFGK